MIHEAIATGNTIDEAIANAKKELNAPVDADVRTEIVAMPQKKILGLFGGSPAKARAWYETPDAPAAPVKAEKPAKKSSKAKVAGSKADEKVSEVKAEKPAKAEKPVKAEKPAKAEKSAKAEKKPAAKKAAKKSSK